MSEKVQGINEQQLRQMMANAERQQNAENAEKEREAKAMREIAKMNYDDLCLKMTEVSEKIDAKVGEYESHYSKNNADLRARSEMLRSKIGAWFDKAFEDLESKSSHMSSAEKEKLLTSLSMQKAQLNNFLGTMESNALKMLEASNEQAKLEIENEKHAPFDLMLRWLLVKDFDASVIQSRIILA